MKNFFWTMLLGGLMPAIAAAQTQVSIFSFDNSTCAAWLKTADNKAVRAQFQFWIQGFASGHNYANPARQVKALPGSEDLYRFLDAYCRENPTLTFVGGAIALVEDLREPAAPAKKSTTKSRAAKPATK